MASLGVFPGCDLAQGPKIELLPIEPDDLACDLLEAIHAGTLLLSNGGMPGRARALLLELTIPAQPLQDKRDIVATSGPQYGGA